MPKKTPEKIGSVLRVPLSQLHPHPQNPFAVRDDSAMQELKESVSQNGVLVPAIARPRAEGGYELIAGHRRKYACEQAGQDSMPVIVLNLNDDEAVIQLVDSNIQREDILPSERAKAYKMKMDAIKRQGARTDLTSPNISAKFRSDDSVGEKDGISGDTVRNYISLNNLTPPLMRMVDEKKIALTPAYQLAALSTQEQELLVETMSSEQTTPSLSQAQRMRKLSQSGELNEDTMLSIMMEQKKPVKLILTYQDSFWVDDRHKSRMEFFNTCMGYVPSRNTPAYYAAMYLLTANETLYWRMANCFCHSGLDFSFAILRGISPHNYALYRAAVGLCTDRRGVTLSEMADRELVDDEAFRLIINAMLIARYGIAAMKLKKEEPTNDK